MLIPLRLAGARSLNITCFQKSAADRKRKAAGQVVSLNPPLFPVPVCADSLCPQTNSATRESSKVCLPVLYSSYQPSQPSLTLMDRQSDSKLAPPSMSLPSPVGQLARVTAPPPRTSPLPNSRMCDTATPPPLPASFKGNPSGATPRPFAFCYPSHPRKPILRTGLTSKRRRCIDSLSPSFIEATSSSVFIQILRIHNDWTTSVRNKAHKLTFNAEGFTGRDIDSVFDADTRAEAILLIENYEPLWNASAVCIRPLSVHVPY
jgi:hypothetical protein